MKKFFIVLVSVMLLGSINANGQRPIGDTIPVGSGDYLYHNFHTSGSYHAFLFPYGGAIGGDVNYYMDLYYFVYITNLREFVLCPNGQWSDFYEFYQAYPDIGMLGGRHITGQEFACNDDLMVRGLAVCPTIFTDVPHLIHVPFINTLSQVVDTTMAGRETGYVQLYTIEGGLPQLQAEGAWRWEDAHRYMYFPHHMDDAMPITVPLYETLFDSSILISGLAGTHNNNGIVLTETSAGSMACWEHYPTT